GTNASKVITANFLQAGIYNFQVTITDPPGNTVVSSTQVVVNLTSYTLWPATATPAIVTNPDAQAITMRVKFQSDVAGSVVGIRFYKSPQNTGTHSGQLWDGNGNLLAQGTFTNETASGWQQMDLTAPVVVQANTSYMVSYHTNTGYDSVTLNYFTPSGV